MKVVIDLDDELYNRLKDNSKCDAMDMIKGRVAIKNGTPLSPRVRIAIKCKYDSLENCHSTDCLACVLEKMRNEIIELRREQHVGIFECLDIIDRYKKEYGEEE